MLEGRALSAAIDRHITREPAWEEASVESDEVCGLLESATEELQQRAIEEIANILRGFHIPPVSLDAISAVIKGVIVSQETIDKVTDIVEKLVIEAAQAGNCSVCMKREDEAMEKMEAEERAARALREEQEADRWAAMSEEEKDAELDRMLKEDPTGR